MVGAFYFLAGPEGSGKKTLKLGPDATKTQPLEDLVPACNRFRLLGSSENTFNLSKEATILKSHYIHYIHIHKW